jgi:hypothetical protein
MLSPAPFRSVFLASLLLAGCSGANAPSLPSLTDLTGSITEAPIVGPPTEVYERIARGVLACWFGAAGPLKADYVYHAEADPPGKGGKAEIVIHERNRASDNPKGERGYRIGIAPDNETTTLTFENLKMAEGKAAAMEADARRWGAGGFGCAEAKAGGWSDNDPTPPTPPAATKAKQPPKKREH